MTRPWTCTQIAQVMNLLTDEFFYDLLMLKLSAGSDEKEQESFYKKKDWCLQEQKKKKKTRSLPFVTVSIFYLPFSPED